MIGSKYMKVIGITGGVGSGKSKVLKFLSAKENVVVCEADKVAHELQKKGTLCYEKIIACFGECILDEHKEIDRKALGNIVFSHKDKLQDLNEIIHPQVRMEIQRRISMEATKGTVLFILEAALLLESDYQSICHEVWYIYCQEAIRMERLALSRNYTVDKFQQIIKQQLSEMEFKKACQVTIDNSKDEDTLYQAINKEIERLQHEIM